MGQGHCHSGSCWSSCPQREPESNERIAAAGGISTASEASDREARKNQAHHLDDRDYDNDDLADAFDPSVDWQQIDEIENQQQYEDRDENSDDHLNLLRLKIPGS